MTDAMFSFFEGPITNPVPSATCTLKQVYKFVTTNSKLEEMTTKLRAIPPEDEDAQQTEKRKFPSVTVHGVCRRRNNQSFIYPSGEICIDIDKMASYELACKLRDELFNDVKLKPDLVMVSSRGKGVKAFIPFDVSPYEPLVHSLNLAYLTWWTYVEHNYGGRYQMDVDRCGDLARACFLCFDSGAKIRM